MIESKDAYSMDDPKAIDPEVADACHRLIEEAGADVIVLLGAVMSGAPRRPQPSLPLPLIDGIAAATRQLELLVRMRPPKARTGSFAHPGPRELRGVGPAIDAALRDFSA